MKKFIFLSLLLLPFTVFSQEINCTISANMEALTVEARENLSDFIPQLEQYINTYRWTKEGVGEQKINCTFDLQFTGSPREKRYTVQAFIGSQRPIYQMERNTALVRILDDKWEFDYTRNQSISHNETRFDMLTSFVDYYMYVILGYDFDSYRAGDGTPYFQRALEIVSTSRGAGKGWEISTPSGYSRGQLMDEMLSPKFIPFREALAKYHYTGLDLLAKNEDKGRKNVLAALESIGKLQQKINQRSQLVRIFFDTKYMEIAEVFRNYPDIGVYQRLAQIDPSHKSTYEEVSQQPREN